MQIGVDEYVYKGKGGKMEVDLTHLELHNGRHDPDGRYGHVVFASTRTSPQRQNAFPVGTKLHHRLRTVTKLDEQHSSVAANVREDVFGGYSGKDVRNDRTITDQFVRIAGQVLTRPQYVPQKMRVIRDAFQRLMLKYIR